MGTKYRKQSEANLYHVTFRGVAQQIIFECDDDRRFMSKRMRRYLEELDIELFAWCFMSNHVHLIIGAELNVLVTYMQKLLISYAYYYNTRYDRCGHLFQRRFDSVPIQSDEQLVTTIRYVHRNPDKIPNRTFDHYEWSSYREYLSQPFITSTAFALSFFGGIENFARFHNDWDETENVPEFSRRKPLDDIDAAQLASELTGIDPLTSISLLDKPKRNCAIATLKASGMPISQIARITGIGRNIIQRAK